MRSGKQLVGLRECTENPLWIRDRTGYIEVLESWMEGAEYEEAHA